MTEKRFVPIGVEQIDGFVQDHYDDKDLFSIGAVCNLLNQLYDENEQLKSINQELRNELKYDEKIYKELKKIDDILDEINSKDYLSRKDCIEALNRIDEVVR